MRRPSGRQKGAWAALEAPLVTHLPSGSDDSRLGQHEASSLRELQIGGPAKGTTLIAEQRQFEATFDPTATDQPAAIAVGQSDRAERRQLDREIPGIELQILGIFIGLKHDLEGLLHPRR